jgi:hypothetical protein
VDQSFVSDMKNAGLTVGRYWYRVPVAHDKLPRGKVDKQQVAAGLVAGLPTWTCSRRVVMSREVCVGKDPSAPQWGTCLTQLGLACDHPDQLFSGRRKAMHDLQRIQGNAFLNGANLQFLQFPDRNVSLSIAVPLWQSPPHGSIRTQLHVFNRTCPSQQLSFTPCCSHQCQPKGNPCT